MMSNIRKDARFLINIDNFYYIDTLLCVPHNITNAIKYILMLLYLFLHTS